MKNFLICKFCNQKIKLRCSTGTDRHGNAKSLRYIPCSICDVNSYFDDNNDLIKLVYHVRRPGYKFVSMNLLAQHTNIGYDPNSNPWSQFLEFDGCWPDTSPNDIFALVIRLEKLTAFA